MTLVELGLPGLVFLGLCIWLVRKAVQAARTERELEGERLSRALADDVARLTATPLVPQPTQDRATDPLAGADLRGANPEHVRLLAAGTPYASPTIAGVEKVSPSPVAWVRSSANHVVWGERRPPGSIGREVICVARIEDGAIAERWTFD